MYEFGDGCVLDSESVGNYPHVDMRGRDDPVPSVEVDSLKSACERWYREDQQKALMVEQIRRNSAEYDMRVFECVMNIRRRIVICSLVISAFVVFVFLPVKLYRLYNFFSSKPVEVAQTLNPVPAPKPEYGSVVVPASQVPGPALSVPSERIVEKPVRDRLESGFWYRAFNP